MGRHSTFTQEIADAICERLSEGESLNKMCREESMPSIATVFRWLNEQPTFETKYVRAREVQAEVWADQMHEIADNSADDWTVSTDSEGNEVRRFNGEAAARSKIRLEQRRWYAEKLLPKKYGLKADLNLSGNVAVNHTIGFEDPAKEG